MKSFAGFVAVLFLAAPALAQVLPDGGAMSCVNDADCGGVCGWVCSWQGAHAANHVCVPALLSDGGVNDPGWCSAGQSNPGCACAGQSCSGTSCTPAFQRQCLCDSDCPGGDFCDLAIGACRPQSSGGSCNLGEQSCGCLCAAVDGGTEWDCLGGNNPGQACATDADCAGCEGYTCVNGACTRTYASCLDGAPADGGASTGGSGGTTGAGATGGSTGGSGGSSGGGASSGGGSSGGASTGGSTGAPPGSGGGSSGGACFLIGGPCQQDTDCCSQRCKANACACNPGTDQYPCKSDSDCCIAQGAFCGKDLKCQSAASEDGGASGGGTTGAGSGKSGCGCGAGGAGVEGFAMLALALGALATRRRRA